MTRRSGPPARIDPAALAGYLVTDTGLCGARGVVDTVALAVEGGIGTVQLREKTASAREAYALLLRLAEVVAGWAVLLVDDRVDLFLAARAAGARVDGVHLGQDDLPALAARALIGPDAVLGISAATPDQVATASIPEVDYLGIGAIRATTTKPDHPTPLGIDGFARLAAASTHPSVAIGGIGLDDVAPLRAAGAAGVAVVSLICAAEDPARVARAVVGSRPDAAGRGR
ncbi:thiamine phosphate synthase [Mycetocola reblochoni]|uniref:thiamine phosphate synthase n=1 Tax=Mycetocola reblochoni TaxID=331618 RepID=UPI003F9C46E9